MSEALLNPLSTPIPQAVGWALLHFLWQGALVALGLRAALALMRGRSSAVRYGLAVGALMALLVLPVATAFRSYVPEAGPAVSAESGASPLVALQTAPAPRPSGAPVPSPAAVQEILRPYLPALCAAWLAGVVLVSFFHFGGWLQARRLTLRGTRPVSEAWTIALRRLRNRLGIERAVTLLESSAVPVPAVVGWLRPVILVPASAFAGLTPEQLEAVLAHELAHVRRHDYLVNLFQALVESLLFYHPAVWWVSRQVRQERECCCDDLAVAVCGDRLGYARALATLEGLRAVPQPALGASGAGGGSLLLRIRRIAGLPERTGAASPVWLTGLLALALLAAGAIVQDGAHAEPPATGGKDGSAIRGQWTAERDRDGLQLNMTYRSANGPSMHGHHYKQSDLAGLGPGPDVHFEMRREAGTFRFDGRFDGSGPGAQGSGTFTFQSNPEYVRDMAGLGYEIPQTKLVSFALFDVSRAFVQELRSLGYDDLSLDDLVSFRIHGVDADLIRALNAAGYENVPAKKLVSLRIHGATPEFARGMAELGYRGVSLDELVGFRIHGVTPEFIREVAATGHQGVPAADLVSMRIHGVSPDFIRRAEARAGHALTIRELVGMKIHGSVD